jgi:hypothetical protein
MKGRVMRLVFIYGLPATGKLTVARELADITGFKLFHNHLAVDLLLSVFEFGSKPFVELREEIWLLIFAQAAESKLSGLIFTFVSEATVRPDFVERAVTTVSDAGGEVEFVELICPFEEIKRRIDSPQRRQFGKLVSAELLDELHARGTFDTSAMPKPKIRINTGELVPAEAAAEIAVALGFGL